MLVLETLERINLALSWVVWKFGYVRRLKGEQELNRTIQDPARICYKTEIIGSLNYILGPFPPSPFPFILGTYHIDKQMPINCGTLGLVCLGLVAICRPDSLPPSKQIVKLYKCVCFRGDQIFQGESTF